MMSDAKFTKLCAIESVWGKKLPVSTTNIYNLAYIAEVVNYHRLLAIPITHQSRLIVEHKGDTITALSEFNSGDDETRGAEHVQRLVSDLHKKTEAIPAEPRYLLNWRHYREGGYQFFPEGRPE